MRPFLCRYRHPLPPMRVRAICPSLGLVGVFFLLSACGDQPVTGPGEGAEPPSPEAAAAHPDVAPGALAGYAPGRVLVRFVPGANPESVGLAHGASPIREFMPGAWIAQVPEGSEVTVASALARNPNVVFAEPDYKRVFGDPLCPECARPADQLFEWQWNMHNDGDVDLGWGLVNPTNKVDADIDWLEAFDLLGPAPDGSVKIGVLDTGIRASHVDFCGKEVTWRDFYTNPSPTPFDDHGHGTHVSGIAGACAGNASGGVVGVAYGPNMDFIVGKVCAADGSCLASAISEAIRWAVDNGANVINMSFGDTQQSQAEAEALAYAASQNVLPVCAAGNDGVRSVLFPAADPNCVAVSATDFGDELASYSSFGPQVELSAPGGDMEDLFLGTSMIASTWSGWDDDYVSTAGTSMAAPHVTGLAALLRALGVTNASDIRACLRNTAEDLGPSGWDEQFGWGRINMYQAVLNAGSCAGSGGGGGDPGENVPPSASFTHSCEGLACTFDGTGSWDPDGTVVAWAWDFGDGTTGTGSSAAHTYPAPGTYTVQLTVTDDDGASATATNQLSMGVMYVKDLEGWSEAARANRWQAFLEVLVADNNGGPVAGATVSVAWSGAIAGSGSQVTDADGVVVFNTGKIRGDGSVTFTVTGISHPSMVHDPSLDAEQSLVVGPPNAAPQADFVESCGPMECAFSDRSTDADGTIVSWLWSFGDGATSTEQNPTHGYEASGDRFVTLTVTDDQGATGYQERWIFVPPLELQIVLAASPGKVRGVLQVELSWTIYDPLPMYVRRDGVTIAETDGASPSYLDVIGRKGESAYTYQVCVIDTNVCSNQVTVTF